MIKYLGVSEPGYIEEVMKAKMIGKGLMPKPKTHKMWVCSGWRNDKKNGDCREQVKDCFSYETNLESIIIDMFFNHHSPLHIEPENSIERNLELINKFLLKGETE